MGASRTRTVETMAILCACAASGVGIGCALNRQGHREVSELLAEYDRRGAAASTGYGSVPRNRSDSTSQPTADARLQQLIADDALVSLIAVALERNPDILAAMDSARSMASRIPQATALSDPMLMTKTLPEPTRTADGDMVFVLSVQQMLPIPQKLDRRGRMALAEARMTLQQLEQTRLRVIADVKRSYFQLLAIDKSASITRENQRLLRDLIDVARGQMIAGRRPQEDVLRAQVELSNLERELLELAQRRTTTAALLNSMLDRPPRTEIASPPEYDVRRLEPRLMELLAEASERNPELRTIQQMIEKDEQALALAQLEYWPDFTVGFEWMAMTPRRAFVPPVNPETGMRPPYSRMSEEGMDSWAVMAGVNLPIWYERLDAGVRESRDRLSASRRQLVSAKNRISYRVQDAVARIHAMRDIARLYATAIIPQAEQTFQVSREGYVSGTTDFQYVIDNWQKWLFFRVQYYRTLADLEVGVADLEEVVGVSMIEVRPEDGMTPSNADDARRAGG